jgi:hypothetical protein
MRIAAAIGCSAGLWASLHLGRNLKGDEGSLFGVQSIL